MANNLVKFAPIGLVAGAMGYFCWSHLDEAAPAAPGGAAAKTGELTAVQLQPPAAPALSRDPFVPHDFVPPEPPVQAKKETPAATVAGARPEQSAKVTPPPPDATKTKPVTAAARVDSPQKSRIAGDYTLSGTYVSRGGQRMAIINGSIYTQGQRLAIDKSAKDVVIVDRVDVDKVVLRLQDDTSELVYSQSARRHEVAQRPTAALRGSGIGAGPPDPFATEGALPADFGPQLAPLNSTPAPHLEATSPGNQ